MKGAVSYKIEFLDILLVYFWEIVKKRQIWQNTYEIYQNFTFYHW